MQYILSDHNCEGQAEAIFDALRHRGFLPLLPMALVQFRDVGLDFSANDRDVWQFCQENGYLFIAAIRQLIAEVACNSQLAPPSVPLMHEAWRAGVAKFIAIGTVCAYPNPSTGSGQGSRRQSEVISASAVLTYDMSVVE